MSACVVGIDQSVAVIKKNTAAVQHLRHQLLQILLYRQVQFFFGQGLWRFQAAPQEEVRKDGLLERGPSVR